MKMFLDFVLCFIILMLLLGAVDQLIKLTQENLITRNSVTGPAGKVNLTYLHRLVILVVETAEIVILRLVVLNL